MVSVTFIRTVVYILGVILVGVIVYKIAEGRNQPIFEESSTNHVPVVTSIDQAFNQSMEMRGTFEDFEVGDYGHLTIHDEMGNLHKFWLGDIPYETLSVFIDGDVPRKEMKGKPVIVTWERRKGFIPESGPDSYQDVITDIKEIIGK